MASIRQRVAQDGSNRYSVRVRLRGYPTQTATFRRLTDARRWAQKTEEAIREGRQFGIREASRRLFAELIDRYLQDAISGLAPEEQRKRRAQLLWWRERLDSYLVSNITPALIAECRDELRDRSTSTQNRYLGALSRLFTIAVKEWGWAEANPVRRVQKRSEPRGRVRFLTDEERERLLTCCRQSADPRLFPLVVLALTTGARQGELLSLSWGDIDLERAVAVLHETKNRERRALPLSSTAIEELRKIGHVRQLRTDLVFANLRGCATFPRYHWETALREAQIHDFRWHDLRHTTASYLAMKGASLMEIATVLGHKTLAMVKRYSHLTEQHTATVVQKVDDHFFS